MHWPAARDDLIVEMDPTHSSVNCRRRSLLIAHSSLLIRSVAAVELVANQLGKKNPTQASHDAVGSDNAMHNL
ncbi:hypothetical protein M5D96_008490 [Drosophila gunungcola]|uniref:Uncharacterized protein n=1 Tax=Drosophila gunungcola TaxID=103775 RepID=A0A9Q0BN41_9MUSC|nr:hypothetical protein M5D96_008490 [Drosophila gunungcola]